MEEGLGKELDTSDVAQLPCQGKVLGKSLPCSKDRTGCLCPPAFKGCFKDLKPHMLPHRRLP